VRERQRRIRRARLLRNALERRAPFPVARTQIGAGVEGGAQVVVERRILGEGRRRLGFLERPPNLGGAIALLLFAGRMDRTRGERGREGERCEREETHARIWVRERDGAHVHPWPPKLGMSSFATSTVPCLITKRHFQIAYTAGYTSSSSRKLV